MTSSQPFRLLAPVLLLAIAGCGPMPGDTAFDPDARQAEVCRSATARMMGTTPEAATARYQRRDIAGISHFTISAGDRVMVCAISDDLSVIELAAL
jgi:hypothetical protein